MIKELKGLSLFASAGIAEMNLAKCGIDIKIANELLMPRCIVHKAWNSNAEIVCGDITKEEVKNELIEKSLQYGVDFILATPPCQGVSLIGKNKTNEDMLEDQRNFLIFHAFDVIDKLSPNVIVIENVARFLSMKFPYNNEMLNIEDIVKSKYAKQYQISVGVYNSADYGVPQTRHRAIIVMCKNGYEFTIPEKQKHVTVREAIYDLPSLESGETSKIKNHNARKHAENHVLWMKHTPTGKSATENDVYFPQNKDGKKLKCYSASYKRIDWDKPAPTITMRNDAISSQSNVHPGRLKEDGTYSDARVLTLRELFILSSINPDIDVPNKISDAQIRQMIGEAVPPKLMEAICKNIRKKD